MFVGTHLSKISSEHLFNFKFKQFNANKIKIISLTKRPLTETNMYEKHFEIKTKMSLPGQKLLSAFTAVLSHVRSRGTMT